MASMTDVIFLLLIFFMVTSTYVFPTALEVNLPESSRQTALKPSVRIFIDATQRVYVSTFPEGQSAPAEPQEVESLDALLSTLQQLTTNSAEDYIAVYADEAVTYGKLVEILDLGARTNLKMVLATKPAPQSARPAASVTTNPSTPENANANSRPE